MKSAGSRRITANLQESRQRNRHPSVLQRATRRNQNDKRDTVTPRHETLEDLFLREIANADKSTAATEGRV